MAEQPCLPQVQACAMRISKLDANGVPTPGAGNLLVTDALSQMSIAPNYSNGAEIEQKNACGSLLVNYKSPDNFKRLDVTLDLVTPDPYVAEFLSGGATITDGDRIGFASPALGLVSQDGVSVELWSKRIDEGDLDTDSPYAWWVYPKITNLRLGNYSHADAALLPQYTGQAYENPNWFDGPLNDWPAASDRAYQWIPTATLPTTSCGPQTLAAS